MGIISTFRTAFGYRLNLIKNGSWLNKKIHYMGKRRLVWKENKKEIWLKGIIEPINKDFFKNKYGN